MYSNIYVKLKSLELYRLRVGSGICVPRSRECSSPSETHIQARAICDMSTKSMEMKPGLLVI